MVVVLVSADLGQRAARALWVASACEAHRIVFDRIWDLTRALKAPPRYRAGRNRQVGQHSFEPI